MGGGRARRPDRRGLQRLARWDAGWCAGQRPEGGGRTNRRRPRPAGARGRPSRRRPRHRAGRRCVARCSTRRERVRRLAARLHAGAAGEPTDLRCTGLYSDWATRTVAANVRQYDPGLHLWSDGASKTRWIYLPPGTKIDTSNMDQWTFALGTKVWKEFVVGGARTRDAPALEAAERRLVLHHLPLVGRPDRPPPSSPPASSTPTGRATRSPRRAPATTATRPLRRRARVRGGGAVVAAGVGRDDGDPHRRATSSPTRPQSPITIPGDATAAAALGYLHMNCGNPCHNPDTRRGARTPASSCGSTSRRWPASQTTADLDHRAWAASPSSQSRALTNPQIFTPCNPDDSAAYYRMDHRDGVDGTPGGMQMPPEVTHTGRHRRRGDGRRLARTASRSAAPAAAP